MFMCSASKEDKKSEILGFFFNANGKPIDRKRLKMWKVDYIANRKKFREGEKQWYAEYM